MIQPCSALVPIPITSAMIISTSVLENDYEIYNPLRGYLLGERCISPVTHRIYESVSAAANVGHDPTNLINQFGAVPWWVDQGPTNLGAMFDSYISTQCVAASEIRLTLRVGPFNAIALFGLDAGRLEITVRDAPDGDIIYQYDGVLEGSAPADFYEFYFDRFKPLPDFVATGIDTYHSAETTLRLSSASGLVKCGMLALGDMQSVGLTEYGAQVTPKSYAYIDTDKFGRTKIQPGPATTDMSLTTVLDTAEAASVFATLKNLQGVPCVVIATNLVDYSPLRTFGLITPNMTFPNHGQCKISVDVKGFI